jgi:hypothetical protein
LGGGTEAGSGSGWVAVVSKDAQAQGEQNGVKIGVFTCVLRLAVPFLYKKNCDEKIEEIVRAGGLGGWGWMGSGSGWVAVVSKDAQGQGEQNGVKNCGVYMCIEVCRGIYVINNCDEKKLKKLAFQTHFQKKKFI